MKGNKYFNITRQLSNELLGDFNRFIDMTKKLDVDRQAVFQE